MTLSNAETGEKLGDAQFAQEERWRERGLLDPGEIDRRIDAFLADADPAVRFQPCPPGTRKFTHHDELLGPETGWAGGFVVAHPGCATLFVRRQGAAHSVRVRIGFSARC